VSDIWKTKAASIQASKWQLSFSLFFPREGMRKTVAVEVSSAANSQAVLF